MTAAPKKAVQGPPAAIAGKVYVPLGSPAYRLWDAWWRRTKGVCAPCLPNRPGWYFPSLEPPIPTVPKHWAERDSE